jgi:hypothetical protein
MAFKSCISKQQYMAFEGCKIKQHYCECFLHISFLFNFLVINPSKKHNNQQVFHLDFTSTPKIGQLYFPSFLWDRVMSEFPTSQCFFSLAILIFVSILISAHLIEKNKVNTMSFESLVSKHNDALVVIWFFILISLTHHLHLESLVTHPIE